MRISRTTADEEATAALHLDPEEVTALGGAEVELLEPLAGVLEAVAGWRGGHSQPDAAVVIQATTQLIDRLEGVRDAAIRDNPQASHGELAQWLGVHRQTVASRRRAGTLPPAEPAESEWWARSGKPLVEIASRIPGRDVHSYELLDEVVEETGMSERDAHDAIHAILDDLIDIDGQVIVSQRPMRPELLRRPGRQIDVYWWLAVTEETAAEIREALTTVSPD